MGKQEEKMGKGERWTVVSTTPPQGTTCGLPCPRALGRPRGQRKERGATLGQARCQGGNGARPRSSVGRLGQARGRGGLRARLRGVTGGPRLGHAATRGSETRVGKMARCRMGQGARGT
jgi:hypothetical protein